MKTGKKILAVMMLTVFMLAANAALIPATAGAEESLVDVIKEKLKAGKSLQQVIDEALKDGKPIQKIVYAAINAGVQADDVVYVAVKATPGDGSAHQKIVKAVLVANAPLYNVVGAAQAAGAQNADIRSAYADSLRERGFKDASAKAEALDFSKDTYPYSPHSRSTSTSKTKTPFTYTVRNTGGSTPSTKTASPI